MALSLVLPVNARKPVCGASCFGSPEKLPNAA